MVARISIVSGFCAALLAASLSAPASADDKITVLEPSSPWNVDYGDEKCRLARFFGEGEDKTLLFMEQWGPDTRFGFTAAGPAFERFKSGRKTEFWVHDNFEPITSEPFTGEVGDIGTAVIYSTLTLDGDTGTREDGVRTSLPQIELEIAADARFVALKQTGRTVKLMTGPLRDPFTVLNECSRQRIADWGLDIEKHSTLTKMPVWINEQAIARRIASTYPRRALRAGESALLRLRVNIDESGEVTECFIGEATETEYLESPACKEMKKAKFEPALDSEGKPMPSFYHTSLVYRTN